MAPIQNKQLESIINGVLKSGDVLPLDTFLQQDDFEEASMKCSKQFLSKLDQLVNRSLDHKDLIAASLGFVILYKCGKHLNLSGSGEGLSGLTNQSLIIKWFEKCKDLWTQRGPSWDERLFTLSEDFFNALMVVHEGCKDGTYKVTESFLYRLGQLAIDPRIYILIQKEAIRKFNIVLDKIPLEFKKDRKILTSQEAFDIMMKLASQIQEAGDYDFQSSLMEALCRMTTTAQRKELVDQWFSMGHVASAFAKINDSEFETACRKFLNMVNGMQGDHRRVYSYPCLKVYLDKYELLMPMDEKLEEFWIDFNLGSHSISLYFSLADEEAQEGHWEAMTVNENEVVSYTILGESKRKVLQIKMSEVVVVGSVEGSTLTIHFSSVLDILQTTLKLFGKSKYKATSVVKTTMDQTSAQVVPESQLSLPGSEKNADRYLMSAKAVAVQVQTPVKRRVSESIAFISVSSAGSAQSGKFPAVMLQNNPAISKNTPSLGMVQSCVSSTNSGSLSSAFGKKEQLPPTKASEKPLRKEADKYKKNIPVADAVAMVLKDLDEDLALEQNFVPGTQLTPKKNMSTSWNKISQSEILMMPTQKINSLSRSEPHLNLEGQQEHRTSSVQKWSVSNSNPFVEKQLHAELIQRLQKVLDERNEDPPPQEPAIPQRQASSIKEKSKDAGSEKKGVTSSCAPPLQKVQEKDLAEEKTKSQIPKTVDTFPAKVAVLDNAVTKTQPDKPLPKKKSETKSSLSSRNKSGKEFSDSTVKIVAGHNYIKAHSMKKGAADASQTRISSLLNRPLFNMSWVSTSKKEISGAQSQTHTTTKSLKMREDVFAFKVDEPIRLGGKNKTFSDSSAMSRSDIGNSSLLLQTTTKEQLVINKRHVKKHLFSDTETDNAMPEVSWLRESNKKPKPKMITYPKKPPAKTKAAPRHESCGSLDFLSPSRKAVMEKTKNDKDLVKKAMPAAAVAKTQAARRRPKRAATSAKSYKEPDTDDSQSDQEKPRTAKYSFSDGLETDEESYQASPKKRKTNNRWQTKKQIKPTEARIEKNVVGHQRKKEEASSVVPEIKKKHQSVSEQSTENYRKQDGNHQSEFTKPSGLKQRPGSVNEKTSKLKRRNSAAQEQRSSLKDSWAVRQNSFSLSPPAIERMRSAERSAPTLGLTHSPLLSPRGSPLPASPDQPCKDTPSPVLLLPRPHSTLSSKGKCRPSSFYAAEKSHIASKTSSIQNVPSPTSLGGLTPAQSPPTGPSAAEISKVEEHLLGCHSPLSPFTQPLLSSTAVQSLPQTTLPGDVVNHGHRYSFSKMSSVSQVSLTPLSTKSSRGVKESPTADFKTEKTPLSDREKRRAQHHISGPSRKRHVSSSSNSEEDVKEEKKKSKIREQRPARMKPKKLFKSFPEMPAVEELSQEISSHTSYWEAEGTDGDLDMDEESKMPETAENPGAMCQKFNSELKKKLQNRYKMMESYNKQSLKTVEQYVCSINKQITEYRTQRLEEIQNVLLEEIHVLERDDTLLTTMEKDLTTHWKKQATAFRSYQKQEVVRNETLKKTLNSGECHSLEYEERIFASQMCLMRKDMKLAQGRLLSKMEETEIQSVKRGLHSLFFP